MTKKNAKMQIEKALNSGGEHIGDIVYWSLDETAVKADALRAEWTKAGLEAIAPLPETPTPYRALVDATTQAIRGAEGYEYEPAGKDQGETILAVMKVNVVRPGEVEATQEARVAVDASGQFLTDDARHPVVKAIRAKYDVIWGSFQAREVRRAIIAVLDACLAVTIRESGGVYWVPRTSAATVRTLKAVIEGVGANAVDVLAIHEGSLQGGSIARAAKGSIEEELTGLKEELAKFAADPKTRGSTVQNRLDTFQALRAKTSLYHSILAVEVDDLGAALTELEETAAKMLAGIEQREGIAA